MVLKKLGSLFFGGAAPAVKLHLLLMRKLSDRGFFGASTLVANRLQRRHGIFISPKALVPSCIDFKHPAGIVIGDGVVIGKRVVIYQNVTLGGARMGDWKANNYPEIGDDVVVFAGAVIVGKVKVGRGAIIGANAVVTKDVPAYATAVGVPAKVIKINEIMELMNE